MKNLVLSSLMHCPIVAEVMSELSADYYPGCRMLDPEAIVAAGEVTAGPLLTWPEPFPDGSAAMATVDGEVIARRDAYRAHVEAVIAQLEAVNGKGR